MLPSQPSPRPRGGLPSNPRGRTSQSRDVPPPSNAPNTISARLHQRTPAQSVPFPANRTPVRPHTPSEASYASSSSSAESSLSLRRRQDGNASSRTSLDEDYPPTTRRIPKPLLVEDISQSSVQVDQRETGYSVWNAVASAASTLTTSVSKAWATTVATEAGEETPPGQESHLTRAMKAYHLEKARDPSDLPEWLFPSATRHNIAGHHAEGNIAVGTSAPQPTSSRGLRNIYAAAAVTEPGGTSTGAGRRGPRNGIDPYADEPPMPSKATDRLKAVRDAKRNALVRNQQMSEEPVLQEPKRQPRPVGLPRRPKGI